MSKLTIIVGSHRQDSQSLKIGKMMQSKLAANEACNDVQLLDMANLGLPFWSESYSEDEQTLINQVGEQLAASDGFIVISPEWHGTVPSALKNLFLLYTAPQFAHKPALIAGVSAGIGGTYPINELRTTTYKNSRLCYIPEHLIFRHTPTMFNDNDDDDKKSEDYMSSRTDYCLELLLGYCRSLTNLRSQIPDGSAFPNGM